MLCVFRSLQAMLGRLCTLRLAVAWLWLGWDQEPAAGRGRTEVLGTQSSAAKVPCRRLGGKALREALPGGE